MNASIHVQINEYTKVHRSSFLEVKSPIMYVHSPPTVIKNSTPDLWGKHVPKVSRRSEKSCQDLSNNKEVPLPQWSASFHPYIHNPSKIMSKKTTINFN